MWTGRDIRLSKAMIMTGENHDNGDNAGTDGFTWTP